MEKGELLIYQNAEGSIKVDVQLFDETVWLSQAQICALFRKSKATVSEHIRNIFLEGELEENSVVRKFRTTAADGKSYDTQYYNLDVIISLGYRVKSVQGTQFRIWLIGLPCWIPFFSSMAGSYWIMQDRFRTKWPWINRRGNWRIIKSSSSKWRKKIT